MTLLSKDELDLIRVKVHRPVYVDCLLAHVDALQEQIAELKASAIRMEQEHRSELRNAAAEQRWQSTQGDDYGSY